MTDIEYLPSFAAYRISYAFLFFGKRLECANLAAVETIDTSLSRSLGIVSQTASDCWESAEDKKKKTCSASGGPDQPSSVHVFFIDELQPCLDILQDCTRHIDHSIITIPLSALTTREDISLEDALAAFCISFESSFPNTPLRY